MVAGHKAGSSFHKMSTLLIEWLTPQGVIAFGVLYGILQAELARRTAKKAVRHATVAMETVNAMSSDMKELALNTNSIQTALNAANLDLGRAEGKAVGRAEIVAEIRSDTVKGS